MKFLCKTGSADFIWGAVSRRLPLRTKGLKIDRDTAGVERAADDKPEGGSGYYVV